jgi:hypothetical protein
MMLNEEEVKIAKLFCRFCKDWTNQVCISDTKYYVNTACLRCGSIYHLHGSFYSNIKFETVKIPNKPFKILGTDDGKGITKSSG